MKNLKKVLALVLVAATLMGLAVSASAKDASDYNDYKEVAYKEAVDVMSAAGVFNGSNGSFNPKGILTREEAAKIVTYMLMGKDSADKLVAIVAPYSDVPASRWSAGAIAYCKNQGILAGVGSNKFDPSGKLTGLQFAKMMLVALGYDATIEKMVGSTWAVNTASKLLDADLDADLDGVTLDAQMTREQAAQMALNTFKANMVKYSDKGSTITINGVEISNGASDAEAVANNATKETIDDDNVMQFAEKYCTKLELKTSTDDFGRPATKWVYDKDEVGAYADEAALTYTTGVKGTDLADDIDDAGYEFKKDTDVDYSRNGGTGSYTYAQIDAALKSSTKIGGNGIVLELYANDDDEITKIVATVTYLGEVTSIVKDKTATKADERALKVKYGPTASSKTITLTEDDTAGFNVVYDAVKTGDKVLVTPKADNSSTTTALTVEIPETVEATITRVNTKDGKLTAGGTVYEIAKTSAKASTDYTADTDAQTLYLDAHGYVLDASAKSSGDDKAVAVLDAYNSMNKDGKIVPMIKGVTSDGVTVNWETDSLISGDNNLNIVYTYTEDDGVYTLAKAEATTIADDGDTVKIASTSAISTNTKSLTIGSDRAYFASDVKFVFINDGKATVQDGVKKVAAGKVAWATIHVDDDDVNYITALYVVGTASNTSATSDDLVYVANASSTGKASATVDGKVKEFNTYEAYINGEEVDFYTEDTPAVGFYTVEIDNDSGAYVLSGNKYTTDDGKLAVYTGSDDINVVNDILSIGNKDYDITNAKIVDLTDNDLDSAAALRDANDDTVSVHMIFNEDDMTVSYVYVVSFSAHA